MRLIVESTLPCSADHAWSEVRRASLLRHVAWPILTFRPLRGGSLPEHWQQSGTAECRLFLFGFVPLGRHVLHFERIDDTKREIQTRERGALVHRWDHLIRIREADNSTCRYSDDVTIEAGWRTPLIWLFARLFYRYRQRRWTGVARGLALQTATRQQSNPDSGEVAAGTG